MLTVAACAMLTACGASQAEPELRSAPDPVIQTERVTVRECPADIMAPLPQAPAPAQDAVLRGSDSGLAFVAELASYGLLLAQRIADAQEECK